MSNKRNEKRTKSINTANDTHIQAELAKITPEDNLPQGLVIANESDADVKSRMLRTIADSMPTIQKAAMDEERSKQKWRNFFMVFFVCLLAMSLSLFIIGIILDATTYWFNLSLEIIIGAFVYFITNIFAVINLMTKYVNNTQYMEIFKSTSDGLLNYLGKESSPTLKDKNNIT